MSTEAKQVQRFPLILDEARVHFIEEVNEELEYAILGFSSIADFLTAAPSEEGRVMGELRTNFE